jgi:hypothetical protein
VNWLQKEEACLREIQTYAQAVQITGRIRKETARLLASNPRFRRSFVKRAHERAIGRDEYVKRWPEIWDDETEDEDDDKNQNAAPRLLERK